MEIHKDPSWLYRKYWEEGYTSAAMARQSGCCPVTIRNWLRHFSIQVRGKTLPLKDRLWNNVDVRGADECWEWVAGKNYKGYGRLNVGGRQLMLAHRLAWVLACGEIPEGLCVCHHCDNPACCNPSHLFLGTNADNMADMVAKGRASHATGLRGSAHPRAKLTEAGVLEIRRLWEEASLSQREIGKMFGVGRRAIGKIVRRENWGWL